MLRLPRAAVAAAAIIITVGCCRVDAELTLEVWNNTAFAGQPRASLIPGLRWNATCDTTRGGTMHTPLSAAITGTLAAPPGAEWVHFSCMFFAGVSVGFVWIDDHQICNVGAYKNSPSSTDGTAVYPIRVSRAAKPWVVRVHLLGSGVDAAPGFEVTWNATKAAAPPHPHNQTSCASCAWLQDTDFQGNDLRGKFNTTQEECCQLCRDDLRCNAVTWDGPKGPWPTSRFCNMKMSSAGRVARTGQWSLQVRQEGASTVAIPPEHLSASTPPLEAKRRALQRRLLAGWGSWMPSNLLSMINLPDSSSINIFLCQTAEGPWECLTSTVGPDDRNSDVRVGLHALDRSYAQMFVPFMGANFSIAWSGGVGNGLRLLVEQVPTTHQPGHAAGAGGTRGNSSSFAVIFSAGYAWYRQGGVAVSGAQSVTLTPVALEPTTLHATRASTTALPASARCLGDYSLATLHANNSLVYPLALAPPGSASAASGTNAVALSSHGTESVDTIRAILEAGRAREEQTFAATYGQGTVNNNIAHAIRAAIMWNCVWLPAEQGPVLPVDRSWKLSRGPAHPDWAYTLFQWDDHFASYMAALDHSEEAWAIAVSNYIQTVRSTKTAKGFGSNYGAGGSKSVDRCEPPMAARVLKALYLKYKGSPTMDVTWVAELVMQDLLDWQDWILEARVLQPLGLLAHGSNAVPGFSDFGAGTISGARMESGMDNSPMYDCEPPADNGTCDQLYDHASGLMQLYDVGFTSNFVAEADALAAVALALGNLTLHTTLVTRADRFRALISAHLWDDAASIFTNRLSTAAGGAFYRRISPTSFYALSAGAATDDQAAMMVTRWLLNASRFAISLKGDFEDNTDQNYWGLPSISGDDQAFPKLGYWRGFVWGPNAQLVYWSLERYAHVGIVAEAKRALAKQMSALLLSQWNTHHHICENFSPHKDGADCTGTKLYHWGALTGLLAFEEDGLYNWTVGRAS